MNDLISIIVPIYNSEKYLCKCLNSIVKQTYSNIEIILIDDGSIDNSGKLCDQLALCDERIIVIHKENNGVSSARNRGIDIATGKMMVFLDADDYIHRDYITTLYNNMVNNKVEFSLCVTENIYENGRKQKNHDIEKDIILDHKQFLNTEILDKFWGSVCGGLFLSKIIKENNIRFNEKIYNLEDMLFKCEYINHIQKVYYSSYVGYYRMVRQDGVTYSKFNRKKMSSIRALDYMERYLSNVNEIEKNKTNKFYNSLTLLVLALSDGTTDDIVFLREKCLQYYTNVKKRISLLYRTKLFFCIYFPQFYLLLKSSRDKAKNILINNLNNIKG